jgi:hypothetical protein
MKLSKLSKLSRTSELLPYLESVEHYANAAVYHGTFEGEQFTLTFTFGP